MTAEPAGETRTDREYRFELEGSTSSGLPSGFRLVVLDYPMRWSSRYSWMAGEVTRTVLAEGITRHQLATVLAGAVSLLAWDGTPDSQRIWPAMTAEKLPPEGFPVIPELIPEQE